MERVPEGTVTFLFTDIEGSTAHWERQPDAMRRAMARHDVILHTAIEAAGGTVFNTAGDAIYAVFTDASNALAAAVAAQRAFTTEPWPAAGAAAFELRVRMGIHTGVAELRDGLYYGPPLNRTARLTAAGHGGQVLLSLVAQQLVRDRLPADCTLRDMGVHRLEDLHHSEHIFQAIAPGMPVVMTAPVTQQRLAPDTRPSVDASLLSRTCPYRGLHAFREEDAPFFFGRETFSARLAAAARSDPMMAVIGPSGSGKSSVVFAGLVPRLRGASNGGPHPTDGDAWLIRSLRPGRRPFHALAATLLPLLETDLDETDALVKTTKLASALRDGAAGIGDVLKRIGDKQPDLGRMLLVADQFEELYALCPDEKEQRAFQDVLFEAAFNGNGGPSMKLALTLRADFMGHALAFREFADAVQDHNIVLGPMTREELAQAIVKPAEIQGRAFEAGLADRILDDVCERSGALPLLEFALAELWQRQADGWLTHQGYESIGRVGGAIAQHADAVYDQLDEGERAAAHHVFVQLVEPGAGTEDTRRLATRDEIGDHWDLVYPLADARLVVASRDADGRETVELVHEALIQSWQRLREWMNADRSFRRWQERLRFSLGQWEQSDRDPGELLRGAPLARAEEWAVERGADLAPAERAFVAASAEARDRRESERDARRQREIDAANRAAQAEHRRAEEHATAARRLGLLALGLIGVTILAGVFWRHAEGATKLANVQRLAAVARAMSLEGQPRRGLLLALEAQRRDPGQSPEVSAAVQESLRFALSRVQGQQIDVLDAPVTASVASAQGHWLATGDATGRVHVARIEDGRSLAQPQVLESLDSAIVGLAFDGRDERLFGVDQDGSVRVWDLATAQPASVEVGRLAGAACRMEVDPTGRWLAVGGRDEELRLWDLAAPAGLATQPSRLSWVDDEGPICALAFDSKGRLLASGDSQDQIKVWDLNAPDIASSWIALALHESDVKNLAFSRDGKWLLSGGGDGIAYLIERSALDGVPAGTTLKAQDFTPGTLLPLAPHDDDVTSVVFAPDGTWLATSDIGGTIRIWQLAAGKLAGPRLIERYRTTVGQLAATPDSKHLISIAEDASIGVWQMPPGHSRIRGYVLTGHDGHVRTLTIARAGDWMITGDDNGSVLRWGLGANVSGIEPLILRGHTDQIGDVEVAPDSGQFASASWDGTVKVWPVEPILAGRPFEPVTLAGHEERATAVVFAPQQAGDPSCTVVSGDSAGNLRLWRFCDAERKPTATLLLPGIDDRVASIAVSPDGRWLVSGDGANRLFAWDLAQGREPWAPIPIPHELGTPNVVRFVAGGSRILAGVGDSTVEEWDIEQPSAQPRRRLRQANGSASVRALAYDEASQNLLAGNTAGHADVWHLAGETETSVSLAWGGGRIRAVALARNGQTALLAGELPFVMVWRDWSEPDASQDLPVSVEGANDIALDPDERLLAVAGADGTVFTWALGPTGDFRQRVALQGHESPVEGVAFLAGPAVGDLHLISYDRSGEIRLWDFNPESLLSRACQAVGRNLSADDEWPQYFPDEPWRPTCEDLD